MRPMRLMRVVSRQPSRSASIPRPPLRINLRRTDATCISHTQLPSQAAPRKGAINVDCNFDVELPPLHRRHNPLTLRYNLHTTRKIPRITSAPYPSAKSMVVPLVPHEGRGKRMSRKEASRNSQGKPRASQLGQLLLPRAT